MIFQPVTSPQITSPYGMRVLNGQEQFHDGIDMVSRSGDNRVFSIGEGTVVYDFDEYNSQVAWTDPKHSGGVYCIVLTEVDGIKYYFKYLHLNKNNVMHGQKIPAGYVLGEYGNTGMSYGAHLHLTIYDLTWKTIDPMLVINKYMDGAL